MAENPKPDAPPGDEPPPHPAEPLETETPEIDIQDLEHKPEPHTRVSNKGVKVEPRFSAQDERDFAREHEAAIAALEEFEKQLKQLPPS
jgi:hypothetical protein